MSILHMDGFDHYLGNRVETYTSFAVGGANGTGTLAETLRRLGYGATYHGAVNTRIMPYPGRRDGDDSKGLMLLNDTQVANASLETAPFQNSAASATSVFGQGRAVQMRLPEFKDAITIGFAVNPKHFNPSAGRTPDTNMQYYPLITVHGLDNMNQHTLSLCISPASFTTGSQPNSVVPFLFSTAAVPYRYPEAASNSDQSHLVVLDAGMNNYPVAGVGQKGIADTTGTEITDRYFSMVDLVEGQNVILGTRALSNIIQGTWNYVEVQADFVASRARLWINNAFWGELPLRNTETGLTRSRPSPLTAPAGAISNNQRPNLVTFGPGLSMRISNLTGGQHTSAIAIDDLYISDANGDAPNNTRLGNIQVVTSFPTSDDIKGFTPSSGTDNFAMVNEISQDGDATYVYASESGATDLYSSSKIMPNYPVYAVGVIVTGRRTGGDSRRMASLIRSGSTDRQGSPVTFDSMNYTSGISIFNKDPATNLNWTLAGAKAVKFGMILVD